jgi:DNA (cytosine-5)-methyltransferase 1
MTQSTQAYDIRSLRRSKGLSLNELAVSIDIPCTLLRQVERGLTEPDTALLKLVAGTFGVDRASVQKAHEGLMEHAAVGEGYVTARPEASFFLSRKTAPKADTVHILDLFCGTGGFSHGFEMTGKFSVCAGLDLLPDRVETFAANHPTANAHCADIHSVTTDRLVDEYQPEIVIGGPPCQGFSSIRPFRNLNDSDGRNNLFEQFAIVVEACRPAWFIMENVVGMLSHQGGETFRAILGLFDQIGYKSSWSVLNAALYGLPQRRERLVIVGSRDGKAFPWPEPTHYMADHRSMAGRHGQRVDGPSLFSNALKPATTVMNAIHDLPELESGESANSYRSDVKPTSYEREMRGIGDQLTLHEATRHSDKMLKIIRHAGNNIYSLPKGLVTSGFSSCYSRMEPDRPAVTLTVNFVHPASNKCIHPSQDRALTPREGARLQGFPDAFKFVGSRAQVVKQIGNAVPPYLGRVIANALLRAMA